jgi:ferric-dicitrate binding protein FerR (iron transport regulator)
MSAVTSFRAPKQIRVVRGVVFADVAADGRKSFLLRAGAALCL